MNEDEIKDIVLNKIKEYYDKGRDELAEFRKNKMVTKHECISLLSSLNKMEKLVTTIINNVFNK